MTIKSLGGRMGLFFGLGMMVISIPLLGMGIKASIDDWFYDRKMRQPK
jgi:hypothetical protein